MDLTAKIAELIEETSLDEFFLALADTMHNIGREDLAATVEEEIIDHFDMGEDEDDDTEEDGEDDDSDEDEGEDDNDED